MMRRFLFCCLLIVVPFSVPAVTTDSLFVDFSEEGVSETDSLSDESFSGEEDTVLPEGLENDVDSLLTDWFLQAHARHDSTCAGGDNIDYPDSVYKQRLAALPTLIEMPYNPIVRKYIDMYVQRRRTLVEYMLGMGVFYFPVFEQALEEEGLPLELRYLPVIESALNPLARSRVGATGLWQFMLGTGRIMKLEINSLVDERCDPVKASQAAARYLKELHGIYNDWSLAIAAYNCGPGNVNKAIRRAGGTGDYWKIYFYLPRETRGYLPAFIAANYVMNYYPEHNLCPLLTDMPLATDTVMVSRPLHLQQVADVLQLPIEQVRKMNPVFRRDLIPADSATLRPLRLPNVHLCAFIDAQDSIACYKADELLKRSEVNPGGGDWAKAAGAPRYHRIRSGETLSTIARKYHVRIKDLRAWNGLKNDRIRAGRRLIVCN